MLVCPILAAGFSGQEWNKRQIGNLNDPEVAAALCSCYARPVKAGLVERLILGHPLRHATMLFREIIVCNCVDVYKDNDR